MKFFVDKMIYITLISHQPSNLYFQGSSPRKKASPMTYQQSLFLIFISLLSFTKISISANTLVPKQSLTGNQTLVSEGQRFELGFFSPGNSKNRYYLGIWFKDISPQTIVWVANRNTPFIDSSGGRLMMDENGHLLLLNQSSTSLIWSSNQSTVLENPTAENTIAKLLDTGNLVVTVESSAVKDEGSYRWQSFNHATDTMLPGMKVGWDPETGVNNSLVSWSSAEDPSPGDFTYAMEPGTAPEMYLLKKRTPIFRSGPWNGRGYSGIPDMASWAGFVFTFIHSENQKYYYYSTTLNESTLTRAVMGTAGRLQRLVWLGGGDGWTPYWDATNDPCNMYNQCGAYGICDTTTSGSWICTCVKGFVPKNQRKWSFRDGSEGCVLSSTYECGKDDGFLKLKRTKLPDCSKTYYNQSMDLKECREMCKRNCSCSAYANSDVTNGGTGCIIWIHELVDLRMFGEGGQDLYVRVAASELESSDNGHKSSDNGHKSIVIIVMVTVISLALLSGSIICFIWKRKKRIQKRKAEEKGRSMQAQELPLFNMFLPSTRDPSNDHKSGHTELPLIDFDIIVAVTDNFSNVNKLGEGGFGSVYKGTLMDGQQIAVKRLSKNSGQGIEEFKNEVMLIAKLQHRNLVRLLGCCLGHQEKMLIYEYMPNKSLDSFLFDKVKGQSLDWGKRFSIIFGIARGLLYLHQDSRLRIIHRDLKASNILLDEEMNPKISDFGMARIFGNDETEANTRRVVGTYGYMAPEYAMDGLFSVKSDVFSYGVLVLEIISGKKNKAFYSSSHQVNLLGYAWRLWEEGKILELTDTSIRDSCSMDEVLKCIQVGLLCVQEHAEDRPTISSVILMLGSETTTLAKPKKPGFSLIGMHNGAYSSSNDKESCSVNEATVTILEAR